MVAEAEVSTMIEPKRPDPRDAMSVEQRNVLRLLAKGHSTDAAARYVRVSEDRVKAWMKTAPFRDALDRERSDPSPRISSLAEAFAPDPTGSITDIVSSPSGRRSKALDLLAAGMSVTEAAELAGYSRQHLSNLINNDAGFAAELARRKQEAHLLRANRLWGIWDKAADRVERAIEEGDTRMAWDMLKLGAPGVTDIEFRSQPSEEGPGAAVIPQPPSKEESAALESSSLACESCGQEVKSIAGLKRHRKARHGSQGQ